MAGTYSVERFRKQKKSWYRETQRQIQIVMAPLRCHGDSDCNKTRVYKKFSSLFHTAVVTFCPYIYLYRRS